MAPFVLTGTSVFEQAKLSNTLKTFVEMFDNSSVTVTEGRADGMNEKAAASSQEADGEDTADGVPLVQVNCKVGSRRQRAR